VIELLIFAIVVVAILATLLAVQARGVAAEREQWRVERRFLIDRVVARHVGELVALEREDTRKDAPPPEVRNERPLIEGLS
jgi:hypothetical protein